MNNTPGKRFENKTLDNFEAPEDGPIREAYQLVGHRAKLLHEEGGDVEGFLLLGDVGTGKTHLLASMWHAISGWFDELSEGNGNFAQPSRLWYFMPDLMSRIRDSYSGDGDDPSKRCREVEYLFLDDLGAEQPTDHAVDVLMRIIDHRYREMLPTFVTSNQPIDELVNRYGQAMISRLSSQGDVVTLEGSDYRMNGG